MSFRFLVFVLVVSTSGSVVLPEVEDHSTTLFPERTSTVSLRIHREPPKVQNPDGPCSTTIQLPFDDVDERGSPTSDMRTTVQDVLVLASARLGIKAAYFALEGQEISVFSDLLRLARSGTVVGVHEGVHEDGGDARSGTVVGVHEGVHEDGGDARSGTVVGVHEDGGDAREGRNGGKRDEQEL